MTFAQSDFTTQNFFMKTIYISLALYQDLIQGTNVGAINGIIDDIKEGRANYVLEDADRQRRLIVDEDDNLVLENEDV